MIVLLKNLKRALLASSLLLASSCFGPDFTDGTLAPGARDYCARYRITSLAEPPAFDSFVVELFRDKDSPSISGEARVAYSNAWSGPDEHGESIRRWFFSPDQLPIIEWGGLSYQRFTGEGTIQGNGWDGTVEYVSDFDGFGLEELPTPARAQRL